jgi:hypothetical protein
MLSILKSLSDGGGGPDGREGTEPLGPENGKRRRGDMVDDLAVVSSALPEYALTSTGWDGVVEVRSGRILIGLSLRDEGRGSRFIWREADTRGVLSASSTADSSCRQLAWCEGPAPPAGDA